MKKHYSQENHKINSAGFLRPAVLGANDGLISTSSLIVGLASSGLSQTTIITTSVAALIAGAMSMAAGEYVSVSSQSDTEKADIEKETKELENKPKEELRELEQIYIERGLNPKLANEVAVELTKHDALGSHLRDELGIIDAHRANPLQAAVASALMFAVGALIPILIVFLVKVERLVLIESIFSMILLLLMGAVAAKAGHANIKVGAFRVAFWGALAMLFTAIVGYFFGATL
ncbi:MAG: VIT1/CCC1 transporter family protein [Bdellovibrionales bacterium]